MGENEEDKRSPLLDVNANINREKTFFLFYLFIYLLLLFFFICGVRKGGMLLLICWSNWVENRRVRGG